jgi:hypothetical protein
MLWTYLCVLLKKKNRILKVLVLVKIWSFFKKTRIFATFVFDPTLFAARKWPMIEKITLVISNDQHVGQKHFHDILIRNGDGNPKS